MTVVLQVLFYATVQLCSALQPAVALRSALSNQAVRDTLAALCPGRGVGKANQSELRHARRAGIRPSLLLLDRGFYSVEVIRYLQAACYGFIMPVVIRGREANDPRGPSATRVFAVQKHSAWAKYTLTNSEKLKATVRICVHCRNWACCRGIFSTCATTI